MGRRTVRIDRGLDIPPPSYRKYPLRYMEVGDSFKIPCKKSEAKKVAIRVKHCVFRIKSRNNLNISIKTKFERNGLRVWRVD